MTEVTGSWWERDGCVCEFGGRGLGGGVADFREASETMCVTSSFHECFDLWPAISQKPVNQYLSNTFDTVTADNAYCIIVWALSEVIEQYARRR